ncbi:hypothetical protein B7494_g1715 [Chlorociboria aeruginascens]|nr:hypothetical protein B7494_g1715 [Chlorociboria aeruginascens]
MLLHYYVMPSPTTTSSTTHTPEHHPGMPVRTSSSNYMAAQHAASDPAAAATAASTDDVRIPDGRKNSQGEILKSPAETWRPDFKRKQSWNQQDLKRELVMSELGKGDMASGEAEKWANEEGMETGFTEGTGKI